MTPSASLPKGWVWRSPEELAAPERNSLAIGPFGSNLKVSDYRGSGTPLVFVRNIRSGDFVGQNPQFVSQQKASELAAHRVDPGDILITKMGEPPGDACVYPGGRPAAIITADCIKFRVAPGAANPLYLAWAIASPAVKEQIGARTKGVAQQKISLEAFRTLQIPLAPRAEQERIVAEIEKQFTRLDAGVASLQRLQAHLRRYRAAVLKAAFSGRPAWRVLRLGDVADIRSGIGFPEALQGRSEGEVPFFKVGDISEAWVAGTRALRRAKHYISKDEAQSLRAMLLPEGSTVFAKIGAAIALNRRALLAHRSLVDNNVMALVADKQRVHPRYLFYFACTLRLADISRATTVPSVRKSDVEGIQIPVPNLEAQASIAERLDASWSLLDSWEVSARVNLARAAKLRASILSKAFRGDLSNQANPITAPR